MKKITVLLFLLCAGITVNAAPITISFEEMMKQSKSIIIGTYLGEYVTGKIYHIECDTVIKGVSRKGIITVNKGKGMPRVAPGTRVMAFINTQDQWEWCGTSHDFGNGIIYLEGFNDRNAYSVYPDAVSLVQLSQFMRTGQFTGMIQGNLQFWSFETEGYTRVPTYFAVSYTYFGKDSTATRYLAGGLNTGLFAALPEVRINGSTVELVYASDPDRPLLIGGRMDSLLPGGNDFVAAFEVWMPANLSQLQYQEYVSNERHSLLCYDLTVLLNSRAGEAVVGVNSFSFIYGEEPGDIGYMVFGNRIINCTQFSMPTTSQEGLLKFGTWTQPEVEIELDALPSTTDDDEISAMPGLRMINIMRTTQLTGQMYVYENGVKVNRGSCVILLEKTRFTQNPDWGNN